MKFSTGLIMVVIIIVILAMTDNPGLHKLCSLGC